MYIPVISYVAVLLLASVTNGISLDYLRERSLSPDLAPSDLKLREVFVQPRQLLTLRILTLGSSIVGGYGSSDWNGFRYNVRNALVADGHQVNMIGSLKIGSMGDNDVEGWGGFRIDQVSAKADLSLPSLPNLVLILAGANDVYQRYQTDTMAVRMGQLVDKIFAAVPGTTIILSTLPPNNNPSDYAIMQVYNANLRGVVSSRAGAGKKIFLVDTSSGWITIPDMPNNNHPNDLGYLKIGRIFYDGIIQAKNVITPAGTPAGGINDVPPPDVLSTSTCVWDPTVGACRLLRAPILPLPLDPSNPKSGGNSIPGL